MNPLLSVIVPVYNTELYLETCLESILNQSYKKLEIILIDDGSFDCSGKICDDYGCLDKRVKVIHQKNKGLSAARNVGLEMATGEYIAFVDSDDYLALDCYDQCISTMERTRVDICCYDIFEQYGDLIKTVSHMPNGNLLKPFFAKDKLQLLFSLWPLVWAKVYKKSFLNENKLRFVEGIIYEDNPFVLGCWIRNPLVVILNKHLHYYRMKRPGQLSGDNNPKTADVFKMMEFIEKDFYNQGNADKYPLLFQWSIKNIWCLYRKTPNNQKKLFSYNMIFQFIRYGYLEKDLTKKVKYFKQAGFALKEFLELSIGLH